MCIQGYLTTQRIQNSELKINWNQEFHHKMKMKTIVNYGLLLPIWRCNQGNLNITIWILELLLVMALYIRPSLAITAITTLVAKLLPGHHTNYSYNTILWDETINQEILLRSTWELTGFIFHYTISSDKLSRVFAQRVRLSRARLTFN